jgi:hypothetical protein
MILSSCGIKSAAVVLCSPLIVDSSREILAVQKAPRRSVCRELWGRRRGVVSLSLLALLPTALTHALHFSGDFLCHDAPQSIGPSERPISLYHAIVSIEKETWRDLARHVFGVEQDRLTADTVLRKAVEIDNVLAFTHSAPTSWTEL